jgi:acyl-coenzyme A thioesterase PaaI-like protein
MIISERTLKWAMRFYPPLFFQRIWVTQIEKGFRGVSVRISRSIFNSNYNRSIFGGTIFSASDPFYAVCLFQILKRKGYNVRIWIKSANINYLKPGFTSLYLSISLGEDEIDEVCEALNDTGKIAKSFKLEIVNKQGELCAIVNNEVYIRKISG